jgi:hypothetical protein
MCKFEKKSIEKSPVTSFLFSFGKNETVTTAHPVDCLLFGYVYQFPRNKEAFLKTQDTQYNYNHSQIQKRLSFIIFKFFILVLLIQK